MNPRRRLMLKNRARALQQVESAPATQAAPKAEAKVTSKPVVAPEPPAVKEEVKVAPAPKKVEKKAPKAKAPAKVNSKE